MVDLAERPVVGWRPWLARYDPGVPISLEYPSVGLDELLRRTAARYPERDAVVFFGRQTTYAALDANVDRLAAGLQDLDLAPGERVALFLPNCPQLVMSFYAVWRAGCVAVPVNPRATGPELSRYLEDSAAAAAIVHDRLWFGLEAVAMPSSLRQLVVADVDDDLPLTVRIGAWLTRLGARGGSAPRASAGSVRLRDLVRGGGARIVPAPAGPEAPASLLYTGGTTGLPKAAVLSHRNLVANACQLAAWTPALKDGAEVTLSALPLVHGYAMTACMNVSVLRGWTQVLVPDARDTGSLLAEIERWRVTVFPGVPTLYAAICGHPDVISGRRDLRSIEACISGAAALPSGIQGDFERITGGRLVEGYGLSEASPATHCNPFAGRVTPGAIGLPLPDTDCRLVDVETESVEVAPGQPGVLCVSGPQVMMGYWRRPEETAQALRSDATGRVWLHTGDVAVMADDGAFRIVDRKKDVIVAAGGLKVYPNEIEDVLSTHPKVRQAAVIGVPVGGADQRAKAFVMLRPGEQADAAEMLGFLRERLAAYKVPKAIEFRADLPVAFTGKVLRRVLADEERGGAKAGRDDTVAPEFASEAMT
jgi:long-chain acyl-CoA synthetase